MRGKRLLAYFEQVEYIVRAIVEAVLYRVYLLEELDEQEVHLCPCSYRHGSWCEHWRNDSLYNGKVRCWTEADVRNSGGKIKVQEGALHTEMGCSCWVLDLLVRIEIGSGDFACGRVDRNGGKEYTLQSCLAVEVKTPEHLLGI